MTAAGYCKICKGRLETNLREAGLPETAPGLGLGQAMLIHLMRDHPQQGAQLAALTGQFSAWLALFLMDYPAASPDQPPGTCDVPAVREQLRAGWKQYLEVAEPVSFEMTAVPAAGAR